VLKSHTTFSNRLNAKKDSAMLGQNVVRLIHPQQKHQSKISSKKGKHMSSESEQKIGLGMESLVILQNK